MGTRELAGVLDETSKDRICYPSHGRKYRRRSDFYVADGEARRHAGVLGHRVLGWIVPAFLLEGVTLLHGDGFFWSFF
jgi:hypothetical protein